MGLVEDFIIFFAGSINLISVPFGCIISGIVTQPIGRKRAMQLVNVPFLAAWLLFSFSTDVWQVFCALAITGASGGLLEAPVSISCFNLIFKKLFKYLILQVITYVAEITEPHLRGMLATSSGFAILIGILAQFLLGTFLPWRQVALINCVWPVTSFFLLFFVPESPHWLVTRRRFAEARKSIAWLRGWTTIESIEPEFQELCKSLGKKEEAEQKKKQKTLWDRFKPYTKRSFLWPYTLICYIFLLGHFCGMTTLQSYAVQIFATLKAPIDKYYATIALAVAEIFGTVMSVCIVRFVGKRLLNFATTLGCGTCFIIVATYAHLNGIKYLVIQQHSNSSSMMELNVTNTTNVVNMEVQNVYQWIPMCFLIFAAFLSHSGIRALPWLLTGEVYANEVRAAASGLSGAMAYVFGFFANKMFLTMIGAMTLPITYWFYGCVSYIGVFTLYFLLPETEGKPLYEITEHFAGHSKMDNKVRRRKHGIEEAGGTANPAFEKDNFESRL